MYLYMIITDNKLLVMEAATMGNLRQYLEAKANETYYNETSMQASEMNFIHQIIEGVEAVHKLDVMSYNNILISDAITC